MKKRIRLFIVLLLCISCLAPEAAYVAEAKEMPFTDVASDADYYDAVKWTYEKGIVKGKTKTSFAPNDNLTRGEFCTMLWRMFGKPDVTSADVKKLPFADAKLSNHKNAIAWCYRQKVINGYEDGSFKPSRAITRGNILVMLYKLAKKEAGYQKKTIDNPFTDIQDSNKNIASYKWAYANRITGDRTLRTGAKCKRWEMVSFLYGYKNAYGWYERVLVKKAWYERVLVKEAWDEKGELLEEAWDEPVWETHSFCTICGMDLDAEGVNAVVHSLDVHDGHGGYTNRRVQVGTIHHEAEYTMVHHDAEYKTVHHDAEYTIVHHDAE